jgi:hypothetical protein
MKTVWIGIDPRKEETRILAMAGAERTLLKARLLPSPSSRTALAALLEAIALWQGVPVRAALVVESCPRRTGGSESSLYRDAFPDFGSALYSLEYVEALRPPRHRDAITGMGSFGDLRQLLLFEVSR